jgi:hypothetical protein
MYEWCTGAAAPEAVRRLTAMAERINRGVATNAAAAGAAPSPPPPSPPPAAMDLGDGPCAICTAAKRKCG